MFTASHSLTLLTLPGVCDVTPRFPLGPHPCNAFALTPGLLLSWLTPLQALCLGREPKARVVTVEMVRHGRIMCAIVHHAIFPMWMIKFTHL
jgi:hypothetical protein